MVLLFYSSSYDDISLKLYFVSTKELRKATSSIVVVVWMILASVKACVISSLISWVDMIYFAYIFRIMVMMMKMMMMMEVVKLMQREGLRSTLV